MTSNPKYQGSYPLILLGPNTAVEASVVLNLVQFYRKLMVRHVIASIIVPRGTSHYGSRGMLIALLASIGAVYNQVITVRFRKYSTLSWNNISRRSGKTGQMIYELVTGWMESKTRWLFVCLLPWFVGQLGDWSISWLFVQLAVWG